jgi:hypothetical protein
LAIPNLGHAHPQISSKVYAHLVDGEQQLAVAAATFDLTMPNNRSVLNLVSQVRLLPGASAW